MFNAWCEHRKPEILGWLRTLHAQPELGFEEHRTADFVAERLEAFGLEVERGIGGPSDARPATQGGRPQHRVELQREGRYGDQQQGAVTLNHGLGVEAVLTSAARVVGADRIEANPRPVMASGDFSRFLEQVPGAFFFVGQDGAFCHHPEFVFDPAIIPAEERRHILPVLPVEERPLRRDERRDPAQESSEGHDIAPE